MTTYLLLDSSENVIGIEKLSQGRPVGKHRVLNETDDIHSIAATIELKNIARSKIREVKDLEDDLTDLKKVVQFMARGFAGLWTSLPQDIKDANPYKDNFDIFSNAVATAQLGLDLEIDQVSKIEKILHDEEIFTNIVKSEYLDKVTL